MSNALKGKVLLYCAGGLGINVGRLLEDFRGVSEPSMAVLEQVYIDTSLSNAKGINESNSYLFSDMDGSGKVRKENYEEIASRTREILQKFPPLDLNVILSSGAGGSGSVIAPSLVSELLERDVPTIVIMVGSTDTRLEIDNTIKTIKSYDAIARLRKTPVVMAYFQNTKESTRTDNDQKILMLISTLMTVWSRENSELDSKDLYNFLHFNNVTTFPVQLASLISVQGDFPADLDGRAISVATLSKQGEFPALPFTPDYQCSGFLPNTAHKRVLDLAPIFLITVSDLIGQVTKELNTALTTLDQAQRARVSIAKIASDSDKPTESGLVF